MNQPRGFGTGLRITPRTSATPARATAQIATPSCRKIVIVTSDPLIRTSKPASTHNE